ncbi:MAG: hypothetical protein FJ130_02215 [Deltaproteobacteria bacterium]|nr:hypothetical protein [Deltaproteobacteria bacterium]
MRKKVNLVFAAMLLAVVSAFLVVEGADAFCVYIYADPPPQPNYVNDILIVDQSSGGDFWKVMHKGDKECCNWQEKSCNKGGKRDSIVRFSVSYEYNAQPGGWDVRSKLICKDFEIQAGGWLTVEGSYGNDRCVRHDY